MKVSVYTPGEELMLSVHLTQDAPEVVIAPKVTDREVLEGFLRRMTYIEINKRDDLIRLMNR